jgi:N-acetylmuramoyl-L-alanine amidase
MIRIYLCLAVLLISFNLHSEDVSDKTGSVVIITNNDTTGLNYEKQPVEIRNLIKNETNTDKVRELVSIVTQCDRVYSDLYEKLSSGQKIKIFFDPAHGLLPNGKWQGDMTWRQSTTNRPEEYYSIPLSRKLFQLLSANKYIEVITTPDFMNVLEGKSGLYNNITFTQTIKMATESDAFMIIASHLNNVSTISRADGLVNLKGIHVTCGENGRLYFSDVRDTEKGFLTLYNKFDPTGLSFNIADHFRDLMIKDGYTPNNWDAGTVDDDRYIYFSHYPISVMFESGFICNPYEEKFLLDPSHQDKIAQAQYSGIIRSIENKFNIDMQGDTLKKTGDQNSDITLIIKLQKLMVHYIRENNLNNAIECSRLIQKYAARTRYDQGRYTYSEIGSRLVKSKSLINLANVYIRKKKYAKYKSNMSNAISVLGYNPLYYSIKSSLRNQYRSVIGSNVSTYLNYGDSNNDGGTPYPDFKPLSSTIESHSPVSPFILLVEENQSLSNAIDKSIAPNEKIRGKIILSLNNVKITGYTTERRYSKKSKKYTDVRVKTANRINFSTGIYIIQFNSKYQVVKAAKVRYVPFDPKTYQNELYFKNSSLADTSKEKGI